MAFPAFSVFRGRGNAAAPLLLRESGGVSHLKENKTGEKSLKQFATAMRASGLSPERLRLHVGQLPAVKVVRIASLDFHERPDSQRFHYLKRRMSLDGYLRNPPIVARDGANGSPLVIDGVNRIEALRQLGVLDVLVQEVDIGDNDLTLSTWHHIVEGLEPAELVREVSKSAEVTACEPLFTPDGDYVPQFYDGGACAIVLPDRRCYVVCSPRTLDGRIEAMSRVVEVLKSGTTRDRVSYTNMADLSRNYSNLCALVCYKGYSKTEVLEYARRGRRFPSGVTRFTIPKRALSLCVPLTLLRDRDSLERKQARVDMLIENKIKQRKIRFYGEPTFHFDE